MSEQQGIPEQWEEVPQEDLRVGDVVKVWWNPGRDTITSMAPYRGPLAEVQGGRIAGFALCKTGMTLVPGEHYRRIKL